MLIKRRKTLLVTVLAHHAQLLATRGSDESPATLEQLEFIRNNLPELTCFNEVELAAIPYNHNYPNLSLVTRF